MAGTFAPTARRLQSPRHRAGRRARPPARRGHELRHQRRPAGQVPDPGHPRDEDRDHASGRLDGGSYRLRGDVVRMARQVAYAEASVTDADGQLVSRSTGTFLLHRPDEAPPADRPGRPGPHGGRSALAAPPACRRRPPGHRPAVPGAPCPPRSDPPTVPADAPARRPARCPCAVCGRAVRRQPPVCFCCRTVRPPAAASRWCPLVVLREYRVGDRRPPSAPRLQGRGRRPRPGTGSRGELVGGPGGVDGARTAERPSTGSGPWSVVTTVPSPGRPGPAPAEAPGRRRAGPGRAAPPPARAGEGTGRPPAGRPGRVRPVCRASTGPASPGSRSWSSTTASPPGRRAQSAAAALRLAGARVVGILAVGRALAPVAATAGLLAAGGVADCVDK